MPPSPLNREELRSALDHLGRGFVRPLSAFREALGGLDPASAQREMIDLLAAVCDDLMALPSAFRDHALLCRDDRPPALRPMRLGTLLAEAERRLSPLAEHSHQDWSCGVDGPDGEVSADPTLCAELLVRLGGNALIHSPPRSTVRVSAGLGPGCWWMRVADSGPGIPPADRDRAFEPFQRLGPERLSPGPRPAQGLGLATCRVLVDRLGGTLAFDDRDRPGLCVTVTLPDHAPA